MKISLFFIRNLLVMTGLCCLFLTSCQIAYIPSMENAPLLQKKGQFEGNFTPANFQSAYSPVDHLGVMMNGQYSFSKWTNDNSSGNSTDYKASRQFIEGGVGYYQRDTTGATYEVYGGAGYGKIDFMNNFIYHDQRYSANMVRTFIQPAIGFTNDWVDFAFSARLLQVRFINEKTANYTPQDLIDLELNQLNDAPYYFLEPAITVRAGYKFIKANFQFLYSYKLNPEVINRANVNFFVGLSFRF